MKAIKIGQIVISIAGRDKNEHYVVVDIKDDVAYVSNGHIRKLDNTKPKKFKHLQPINIMDEEIASKIKEHLKITNMDIRKVLTDYLEAGTQRTEG
jgi:ribosomal protein L14E/L6E/L27E